jgi:glycine cleavage system H lipoate-binding protein
MMVIIEKFLGKRLEIPEDRRYFIKQGLWAKQEQGVVTFGLSEPALILAGGLKDLDWLVTEGQAVGQGETVIFAITGKIMYIDSPIKGEIHFNSAVKHAPELALNDPYHQGWLFKLKSGEETEKDFQRLAEASAYVESLKNSEGCKNPEGLKGGVSGMCKAVYGGIVGQKI